MRPLEIDIYMFDKVHSELTGLGDDDHSTDTFKRCFIDLDEVCAVWQGKTEGLVVQLKNGESFWCKKFTIDQFVDMWRGSNLAGQYPVVEPPKDIGEEIRRLTEL